MVSILIAIGMDFLVGLLFTFSMAAIAYSQRKLIKRKLKAFLDLDQSVKQSDEAKPYVRRNK